MEMSLIELRREKKVGYVSGRLNKTKRISSSKRRSKRQTQHDTCNTMPKILLQKLYESCQHVFRGPGTIPSPPDVQILRHIIDGMQPEDVGLSPELEFFNPLVNAAANGLPRVTQTTIYKCQNFSLCIFFLPATAVIPLHNHPGMTVFSKLLLGTMHIKAYDWVDLVDSSSSEPSSKLARLARLKADDVFTAPCDSSVLYPASGGNIHAFTAVTPCAVLDVLGPPYSREDGRDCSYYKDSPYASLPNGGGSTIKEEEGKLYGWLEEIEMPKGSEMDGIEYLGPQIKDFTF